MKPLQHYLRTGALVAGLLGATALPALAGASPALATPTAYGSGAAVQKNVQTTWLSGWTPPSGDSITYTATTNGAGLAEFGNETGSLDATQDATANPVLDGYVAVDNPVTTGEVGNADTAGGTGTKEVTIPVAQVAEAIELHVPSGITLNSSQTIDLTNMLVSDLFSGNVTAIGGYGANTWGAFLEHAGLSPVSPGPASVGQFVDDGGSTGGNTAITLQLRANGAGATQVLKQYLLAADTAGGWGKWTGITPDENTVNVAPANDEWPSAGNSERAPTDASSDSAEASAVANASNPGYVGYGTIGAALSAGFGATPGASNLLYAYVQDDGLSTSTSNYASPYNSTTGASNVYTGTKLNTSGAYEPGTQTGGGNWLVPKVGGVFSPTGQWATGSVNSTNPSSYTHGWDYDISGDVNDGNQYYPLDIVLWDLSWNSASWGTGNLKTPYYPTPTGTNSVEETVKSYFGYVTGSSGQAATVTPHFAPLPTTIAADAVKAAAAL